MKMEAEQCPKTLVHGITTQTQQSPLLTYSMEQSPSGEATWF
jgi:hypothetical protein